MREERRWFYRGLSNALVSYALRERAHEGLCGWRLNCQSPRKSVSSAARNSTKRHLDDKNSDIKFPDQWVLAQICDDIVQSLRPFLLENHSPKLGNKSRASYDW